MRASILQAVLAVALVLGVASPAEARKLALLVGASSYPKDNDGRVIIPPLQGPRNDVTVMWRLLRANGFRDEDMTVLADGLPASPDFPNSAADPTRSAILTAFAALAERASPGDFAYIHLSSHGSGQPSSGSEPQPYDRNQVLLPLDTRKLGPGDRGFPNGVVDVEIGRALDAIRARGAHVWIVVDMCHAGDSVRAADPEGVQARFVDPERFGITFAAPSASPSDPVTRGPDSERGAAINIRPGQGGLAPLVGFFAVDSRNKSIERPFRGYAAPLVGEDSRLGVFTQLLHRVLATSTAPTYRGLANDIMRELQSRTGGLDGALPVFLGDLDAPVFGTAGQQIRKGWPGRSRNGSIEIEAGALHGIVEKSIVTIHKGQDDKAPTLGRAQVRTVGPASSLADPIGTAAGPAPPIAETETVWITLAEPAVSFVYRLSEPPVGDRANDPDGTGFAALDILRQQKVDKQGIAAEWRPPAASDADILLRIMDGHIWLVPSTGEWPKGPDGKPDRTSPLAPPAISITDVGQTADRLFDALWSLARATNLVRVAGRFQTPVDDLVSLSVERYPVPPVAGNTKTCPSDVAYRARLEQPGTAIAKGTVPGVTHCDLVVVKMQNKLAQAVDAAVLYVDARGGVQLISPLSGSGFCATDLPQAANAPTLFPTKIVLWNDQDGKPSTAGAEHLVVIATERPPGGAPRCFDHLVQNSLSTALTRAGSAPPGNALDAILADAGLASPATRGGTAPFRSGQAARDRIQAVTLLVEMPSAKKQP